MKHLLCLVLLLSATEGSSQTVQVPPVERHTLDNGLTLMLMRYDRVPVVHLRIMVKGGSADDPAGKTGLASMAAALMKEGTMSRSAAEIAEEIDFTGGSLTSGAGLDYCAVTLEVLSKDLDGGIDLFADVIRHPSFPAGELERERNQRVAGLEGMKENPSAVASRVFTRTVYGDHPYGRQTDGTSASLGEITTEDLSRFHRSVFVPGNALLVAVGDFDPVQLKASLNRAFGGWEPGEGPRTKMMVPVMLTGARVLLVDKPDATQTQIRIGNIGVPMNDPERFPIIVANTVFGSGFTSRLIEELRVNRSLTYGASSSFSSARAGGSFVISTFTRTESTAEMLSAALEQLALYRAGGPTPEEVEKAKNYIAGGFARGLQTPGALASRLTDGELYGFPADYLQNYITEVQGVTLDQLRAVIQKRFHYDNRLIVLVMPASARPDMLETFGSVSVIDLDAAIE